MTTALRGFRCWGGGVYDHVSAVIGCHIGHMNGTLPIASRNRELTGNYREHGVNTAAFTIRYANMWPLAVKPHPPRSSIFAYCQHEGVSSRRLAIYKKQKGQQPGNFAMAALNMKFSHSAEAKTVAYKLRHQDPKGVPATWAPFT